MIVDSTHVDTRSTLSSYVYVVTQPKPECERYNTRYKSIYRTIK